MDAPRYRQWAAARLAIQEVLYRWHPEFFPPPGQDRDDLGPIITKIYGTVDRWRDFDLLTVHLSNLERETVGIQPGDVQRVRSAAAVLLAIDFDAIIDREGYTEPDA